MNNGVHKRAIGYGDLGEAERGRGRGRERERERERASEREERSSGATLERSDSPRSPDLQPPHPTPSPSRKIFALESTLLK